MPRHLALFVEAAESVAGATSIFQRFDQVLEAVGALHCPHNGGDQPGSTVAIPVGVDVDRDCAEPPVDGADGRFAAAQEPVDLEQRLLSVRFVKTEKKHVKRGGKKDSTIWQNPKVLVCV